METNSDTLRGHQVVSLSSKATSLSGEERKGFLGENMSGLSLARWTSIEHRVHSWEGVLRQRQQQMLGVNVKSRLHWDSTV
jgi:hypothetical protein